MGEDDEEELRRRGVEWDELGAGASAF